MNNIESNQENETCMSGISVSPMVGGMMANIGDFVKKNAVIIGLCAIGIGATVYFLTRKKKKGGKGLSGIPRKTRRYSPKRRTRKTKRITAKKLL